MVPAGFPAGNFFGWLRNRRGREPREEARNRGRREERKTLSELPAASGTASGPCARAWNHSAGLIRSGGSVPALSCKIVAQLAPICDGCLPALRLSFNLTPYVSINCSSAPISSCNQALSDFDCDLSLRRSAGGIHSPFRRSHGSPAQYLSCQAHSACQTWAHDTCLSNVHSSKPTPERPHC